MQAIILLFCLSLLPAAATPTERSPCPVRFATLPESFDLAEYRNMRLSAEGTRNIKVLHPREIGLFVMRSSGPQENAIYGHYFADQPTFAKDFSLSENLWGMSWMPVAVTGRDGILEVKPGQYRVVLKYIGEALASDGRQQICVAISPAIELSRSVFIADFEDGVKIENRP